MIALAAATLLLSGCGAVSLNQQNAQNTTQQASSQAASQAGSAASSVLGGLLSAATDGQTLGNMLTSVLGLDKVTKQSLIGTWTYSQPGCAFTSENLLAKAGGEAAATAIKQKLASTYQTVGIQSSNTTVTLNDDGTFSAKIAGKSWSGKWTFDEKNYKIVLSGLLLNVTCYAKKNADGIGLLFEASKLLKILQTMATLSGNQTAKTIGDLSKNYDGLRIGFDMKK
jgi:hypothetical protein